MRFVCCLHLGGFGIFIHCMCIQRGRVRIEFHAMLTFDRDGKLTSCRKCPSAFRDGFISAQYTEPFSPRASSLAFTTPVSLKIFTWLHFNPSCGAPGTLTSS